MPDDSSDFELEILKAENEDLKNTLRIRNAREEITKALEKAGARSPELLFDSAKGDLQFAEDGKLSNAAAIFERLQQRFPEQFGVERPKDSIDGGAGINGSGVLLTREALKSMKPAEIAALDWRDVRRVLSER